VRKRRSISDPFTDLLFNALLGFTFLFLAAVMFMNPEAKTGIINPKADYLLTINWPDNNPDDIDIWVEDPSGQKIWFRNKEAGLINLERDDRGMLNDTMIIDGKKVENPLNQEVVTIRGIVPGEYVVNVHYYATATHKPVDVNVKLTRVNPVMKIEYYGTVTLEKQGQEKTAFRFTITPDGDVTDINHLPKKLVILQQVGR